MVRFASRSLLATATLLLAGLACAQSPAEPSPPVDAFSGVKFEEVSHSRAQLTLTLTAADGAAKVAIQYGPDPSLGYQSIDAGARKGPFSLRMVVGGLAPNQIYHFQPVLLRNGKVAAQWRCPGAGIFEGYVCETAGGLPYFRTAGRPSEAQTLPIPPVEPDVAMPAITGRTFLVEVDAEGRCRNFKEMLEAAAKADATLNHEVVIPAGATCYGPFVAPPKSGPGVVVVRPSTPLESLPSADTRIHPSHAPLMATLSMPPSLARWPDALFVAECDERGNACSNGWRMVGIRFAVPPPEAFEPEIYCIVSAEADKRGALLTLDRDYELNNYTNVGVGGARRALLNTV